MSLKTAIAKRKNYAYANARVRAMRGNLIADNEYRKLAKMDLAEIAEFIGKRGYRQEVDELGGELRGEDLVVRAVRQNLARTYQKVSRIAPERVEELLWTYYRKFDIQNVKTVLRGSVDGDDVTTMLLPTRAVDEETLRRFADLEPAEVLRRLPAHGLPDVTEEVDDPANLQAVEDALDRHYYTTVMEAVENGDVESALFEQFLAQEAALTNIALVLRMTRQDASYEETVERLIPTPERTGPVPVKTLAAMDTREEILERLRESDLGPFLEDAETSAEIERGLDRYKLRKGIQMMHTDQLGVNPILGFMVCKEIEVGNLRMIAHARAEGLGEAFIERNLVTGVVA